MKYSAVIKPLADTEDDLKSGDKRGGTKKEERSDRQQRKKGEKRKKAGECGSRAFELLRKIHTKTDAYATTHASATQS